MFGWSIYNGATYYVDVFGKRFQNELEALRKDVAKWQNSPADGAMGMNSPPLGGDLSGNGNGDGSVNAGADVVRTEEAVDEIPLLDSSRQLLRSTGVDGNDKEGIAERKQT